ncbi:YbaB/EbfC family nucleoid-associated protein [bacterium]|nr:YbaB/EbfC family nucleoid-associated protein [bacterium]
MFGAMGDFVQQAQRVRQEMARLQETLSKRTVEVSSGGGMVKVVANGKQQILSVTIDPEAWSRGDKEMLQDLVTAGVNQAIKASQEMVSDEMGKMTGDLGPLGSLLKGMR